MGIIRTSQLLSQRAVRVRSPSPPPVLGSQGFRAGGARAAPPRSSPSSPVWTFPFQPHEPGLKLRVQRAQPSSPSPAGGCFKTRPITRLRSLFLTPTGAPPFPGSSAAARCAGVDDQPTPAQWWAARGHGLIHRQSYARPPCEWRSAAECWPRLRFAEECHYVYTLMCNKCPPEMHALRNRKPTLGKLQDRRGRRTRDGEDERRGWGDEGRRGLDKAPMLFTAGGA